MLFGLKELIGFSIQATDGEIGKISDLYFDDQDWVVRFMIDRTGSWLRGRQVLISPASIEKTDWEQKHFYVSLTRVQVEQSPLVEVEKPLSRDIAQKLADYYNWPSPVPIIGYNSGISFGSRPTPFVLMMGQRKIVRDKDADGTDLQSAATVLGYKISTNDGDLGIVDDFLVDDETWAIRYMIIDTRKGSDGKKILIAPEWIDWISWKQKRVSVSLDKGKIEACPLFDQAIPVQREYEQLLYDHYECKKYWENNDKED
jgi:hypothetical protein